MVYRLATDYERITDENPYDAILIEFPGWEDVGFYNPGVNEHARGAPAVIEFVGNLEHAVRFDYLINWTKQSLLISKRMVRALLSVQLFRHQLFPCRIYSRNIGHLVQDEYSRERTSYVVSNPTLYNNDFVILKMRDTLDCLDLENTLVGGVPFLQSGEEYLSTYLPKGSHIALREPEGGFPPVFYVPGLPYYCFSEGAKQACERAGLKGLVFEPLP